MVFTLSNAFCFLVLTDTVKLSTSWGNLLFGGTIMKHGNRSWGNIEHCQPLTGLYLDGTYSESGASPTDVDEVMVSKLYA